MEDREEEWNDAKGLKVVKRGERAVSGWEGRNGEEMGGVRAMEADEDEVDEERTSVQLRPKKRPRSMDKYDKSVSPVQQQPKRSKQTDTSGRGGGVEQSSKRQRGGTPDSTTSSQRRLEKKHKGKSVAELAGPRHAAYERRRGSMESAGRRAEEEEERERKKKKNEKKVEIRAQKAKEQTEKQATWQKFAKKSEKKGIHIASVSGTSIFKTPDNPYGKGGATHLRANFFSFFCSLFFRSDVCILFSLGLGLFCVVDNLLMWFYVVGVTGSGKGMTENAPRPKTNRPKAKHSKEDDS